MSSNKIISSSAPLVDEMYGEYLNIVIGMSADDFFDMMWNQKNEIYQDILKYEEIFEFAWRKFLILTNGQQDVPVREDLV